MSGMEAKSPPAQGQLETFSPIDGRRLGALPTITPDQVQSVVDDVAEVQPFWAAILGYADGDGEVVDKAGRLPSVWFQKTDSDAPDRQRWHLDISVPHDVAQDRIQAAVDAGGRLVDDRRAPAFWVLEDPDGNKACICTWQSRD